MSDREAGSPDEPRWMQKPVLKVPLPAGQSALTEMIERGRVLEREVAGVANSEDCVRRVLEWQRNCGQWLDVNLGDQAADEFTASVNEVTTYAWMSAFWGEYGGARRRDLRSELQVLTSILQRLPDWAESERPEPERSATMRDTKVVMVIYGHDTEANEALFVWLQRIGLRPREWSQLVGRTGSASPYIGQVLERAFEDAQAVVAFFTPDERVTAMDGSMRRQARPNVFIEAGMALVTHPERTVLITLGHPDLPSDFAGRHYIQLNGTLRPLNEIASRLETAGCGVDRNGDSWLDPTIFPSRDDDDDVK
jgi:predicted nucleotide-binding protein